MVQIKYRCLGSCSKMLTPMYPNTRNFRHLEEFAVDSPTNDGQWKQQLHDLISSWADTTGLTCIFTNNAQLELL